MREGGETLDQLFDTMCLKLGRYLREVGLVPKHINDVVGLTRVSLLCRFLALCNIFKNKNNIFYRLAINSAHITFRTI